MNKTKIKLKKEESKELEKNNSVLINRTVNINILVELTSDGKKTCTIARVFSDIEIINNLKHPYTFVYLDWKERGVILCITTMKEK